MSVVCTKRFIPDPCKVDDHIPSINIHFNRSTHASIKCNPGFVMTACSLSVIAPTMADLKMELKDDTGEYLVV